MAKRRREETTVALYSMCHPWIFCPLGSQLLHAIELPSLPTTHTPARMPVLDSLATLGASIAYADRRSMLQRGGDFAWVQSGVNNLS